ncbi:MAG: hypothetical protein Tsb0016_12220 [Sphingomonadales bacterium]
MNPAAINPAATDPAQRVSALIEPAVVDLGYRLVRVTLGGDRRPKLQVMAERPDGSMSVEDCERLSREISALLDVAEPLRGDYVLEVSSPGIDRPLTRREDFNRYAGFDARITTLRQLDGRKRFTGKLLGIDDDDVIAIETQDGMARIPYDLVEKAKLVLTDALLASAARAGGPGGQ